MLNASLVAALMLALIAACFIGATPLGAGRVLAALVGQGAPGDGVVVWEIRVPRALAAALVGAALGAGGAALQGLLRNPLAEPGVLGVSASATLGASATLYWGLAAAVPIALPLSAVACAVLAILLLLAAASRGAGLTTLILLGVGLSSFCGALMALMMNLAPTPFTLSDLINWTLGSVANRSFDDIALAAPFMAAGALLLSVSGRSLSALTLGEEAAAALGVDVARARAAVVAGAGLLAGGAVALAGAVGFVGLIAPHLVRPFVGYDPARTVVPAALLSALMLVAADIAVRIAPTTNELKLGVVAALFGAPVFAYIALSRRTGDA